MSSNGSPAPEDRNDDSVANKLARSERQLAQLREEMADLKGQRARKLAEKRRNTLARGVRKLISLFDNLSVLQAESDRRDEEGVVTANPNDQRTADRRWRSYCLLLELNPEIRRALADGDDLDCLFHDIQEHANGARSDDFKNIKESVAAWLNGPPYNCQPLLKGRTREDRGLDNAVTGEQACSIEYAWHEDHVKSLVRSFDPLHSLGSSYYYAVLYPYRMGNPADVEHLFLRSTLLLKTVCVIFTALGSADDVEDENQTDEHPTKKRKNNNGKATKSNVATLLNMHGKLTPRAIAYAAVLLHMNLTDMSQWSEEYYGISYPDFYNFIIDFFEDHDVNTAAGEHGKRVADELLEWFNARVFPHRAVTQGSSQASYARLQAQRAAKAASAANSSATV